MWDFNCFMFFRQYMNFLKSAVKRSILFLIELIEKYEFRNIYLDENDISKKIIKSIDIDDYEIETDTGFKPINPHYTHILNFLLHKF